MGAWAQQCKRDLTFVDFALDFRAPNGAPGDALRVEPDVKAFLRKIGSQPLCEGTPSLRA